MNENRRAFQTYVGASLPGWTVAVIVAVLLHELAGVEGWTAAIVAALWIGTDLLMFPRKRRYYTSEPPERRMLGQTGTAISPLAPQGFARVHGELWQAVTVDHDVTLPAGTSVRVLEVRGLRLVVERFPHADES